MLVGATQVADAVRRLAGTLSCEEFPRGSIERRDALRVMAEWLVSGKDASA